MCLEARLLQPRHHLADATADIQSPRTRLLRLQGVGVLRVEARVPTRQKLGVSFVLLVIRLLATHRDFELTASMVRVKPSTRPKCKADGSEDSPPRHGDHGEDFLFFSVPSVALW